jgi:hypothetical protein
LFWKKHKDKFADGKKGGFCPPFLLMRLLFQKSSALKLFSRIIPQSGGSETQTSKAKILELFPVKLFSFPKIIAL